MIPSARASFSPEVEAAAWTLASLPLSYAPAGTAQGAVAVLRGGPGWPIAADEALDAGAAGIVVVHPVPVDVAALRSRRALVVLDSRWAANPVVEVARPVVLEALERADRLECRSIHASGSDLEAALLDQLTLTRALVGPVSGLRMLTTARSGFAAEGVAAGHPVDFEVVCTDSVPEHASVRLLTADGSLELSIPDPRTAQPAHFVVTTAEGAQLSPTLFESGHRTAWRRVRALLELKTRPEDLDEFAGDCTTVHGAFEQSSPTER